MRLHCIDYKSCEFRRIGLDRVFPAADDVASDLLHFRFRSIGHRNFFGNGLAPALTSPESRRFVQIKLSKGGLETKINFLFPPTCQFLTVRTWAMVVAQLVERSLPTREIRGAVRTPSSVKFYLPTV